MLRKVLFTLMLPYSLSASEITINQPKERAIIQRNTNNLASVEVSGSYTETLDELKARLVVMDGYTSGNTTDWFLLATNDNTGSYSGVITDVPAGGWYQIELQGNTNGVITHSATLEKIGIGDIYVIAGQSNSADYGEDSYTLVDDRVCVRESLATQTWRLATSPFPTAGGSGGTPWNYLGDMLTSELDIPIGFMSIGIGGSSLEKWLDPAYFSNRLKAAVQSFPSNGFKAVLWHQGEANTVLGTNCDTYASNFLTLVQNTRTNAGWDVPFYISEASYAPAFRLSRETPVLAGQRLAAHLDPLIFLGPTTNEFHLENADGGKLVDSIHFNAAGLEDHAGQWRDILLAYAPVSPENGDFENNANTSITTKTVSLTDDELHIVDPDYLFRQEDGTYITSLSIHDWRILSTDGKTSADGINGYMNPGSSTYQDALDTSNDGIMENMDGKHVAFLSEGSAGNYFLSSSRALAQPSTLYTLTVSIGVRDTSLSFGGATVEIMSEGITVATESYTKADLDALNNGESAGKFTPVSISWLSSNDLPLGQSLQYRIIKNEGAGTVLDFDNVTVTSTEQLVSYDTFQSNFWTRNTIEPDTQASADYDGDGVSNIIEYYTGSDPTDSLSLPARSLLTTPSNDSFRLEVAIDPSVNPNGLSLETSHNLSEWTDTEYLDYLSTSKNQDSWVVEGDYSDTPSTFFRFTTE